MQRYRLLSHIGLLLLHLLHHGNVFPDAFLNLACYGYVLLALVAEAEVQTEHGRKLPVVGIVDLRVEAVVKRVGVHFQGNAERLRHVCFKAQSGAQVVAQAVVVPCQRDALRCNAQVFQLIVVPSVVQTHTAQQDDIQGAVLILAEQIRQVQQQVNARRHVFPLVILVQVFEAALRLPRVDMQACADNRSEIMSEAQCCSRHHQLVHRGVGRCELQSALSLHV